jgi:hypothetical protein
VFVIVFDDSRASPDMTFWFATSRAYSVDVSTIVSTS